MTEPHYPEARRVLLAYADLRRLTVLERARACALAGIGEAEIAGLLNQAMAKDSPPEALERGATLLYAMALQLEKRLDPRLTWEEAQTWDLALDLEERPDPIAEAEASASVEAAIATGLPPAIAGELSLAQIERYGQIREEANKRAPRRGRRR